MASSSSSPRSMPRSPKMVSFSALTSAEASGSYLWEVSDPTQVSHFLSAENGKRLKSLPFNISKLQWLLEAFPNGDRADNIGSFMVYLTLIALPENWKRVTFLLRLFNAETCSSFTGIATYTKTSNSGGWSDGTLMLNDLKSNMETSTTKISLGCKITILQLIGSINDERLYQYPLKIEYINIMRSSTPIFNLKWVINNKLLQKFKAANVGKKFESDIFYDSWSMRCAPNGKRETDKNNIKLYLLLCALPPNIIHCKVKYTLICDECNVEWINTRDFSYLYPNVGWPNGTMLLNQLYTKYKHLKKLTFRAKIEILKLYDSNMILSDNDNDDDDDDDDDSSSYDSSSNDSSSSNDDIKTTENDGLGDINTDIMKTRKKSNAKKSEMRRRQSHDLPRSPQIISNHSHSRQETDMNTVHHFTSLNNDNASKPAGFQMKTRNVTDVHVLQQFMSSHNQYQYDRNRTGTVIEKQIDDKKQQELNDECLLEYDERLTLLENKFNALSCQLNDISHQLTLRNWNNDNKDLYKMMNGMRRDIGLIKGHLINNNNKDLNEKEEKIKNWLTLKVGLAEYFDIFIENGLDDLDIIRDLNENDLISIGIIKLGHKKKLLKCIQILNTHQM